MKREAIGIGGKEGNVRMTALLAASKPHGGEKGRKGPASGAVVGVERGSLRGWMMRWAVRETM